MSENKKIAIIGAGFSGLSLAYDLSKNGYSVTIFDKKSCVGGLADSFAIKNGATLEKFYHHLFSSDTALFKLLDDLGLKENLQYNSTNTGIFCNGKIYRLSTPLDLLKFKELKFFDRIRMGLGVLSARLVKNFYPLEKIFATDWLIKHCGKNAYEKVWKSLLQGKFGKCYERISAVWIWNKFKLRGGSRNKSGGECLIYYKGGFKTMLEAIKEKLFSRGVKFLLNTPVEKVKKLSNGFTVCTATESYDFSKVVFTGSTQEFINLVDFLHDIYLQKLESIKYLSNLCLVLVLNKKFSDTYWLNIADAEFPFVGIIEHTNFDNIDNYGGKHILYLSKYLQEEDDLFFLTKDELVRFCVSFLIKINPNFSIDDIEESYLFSAKYSQPVIEKDYSKLLFDMKTGIDGLYFTTMAQIYPEDRGTNYAVEYGRKLASVIMKD